MYLDKVVSCWENDWEDYFEIQELVAKEAFIFKVTMIEFQMNITITTKILISSKVTLLPKRDIFSG